MKSWLASLLLAAAVPAAADQYDGFRQHATDASLKPFCRDLGSILGGASFHSGRSLGFSGFDLGAQGVVMFRPEGGDAVLRNEGIKSYGLPWLQAEIGMPFKFDGFIRGVSFQGLTIAGGGLRYGLYRGGDAPGTLQVLISGVGHSVVHQQFSASHVGAGLVGSLFYPKVSPYVGVGFDRARVVVRESVDPALVGTDVETLEGRYTAGLRLKPWQFFYLNLAYVMTHGQSGLEAGMGVRF